MGGNHDDDATGALVPAVVVKGKRSKRQRVHAPPVVLTAAAEWSSSAAEAPHEEEDHSSSGTSADEAASTTEEEEDMALCLVLLSRGEPAAPKGAAAGAGKEKEGARVRSRRPAVGADGAAAAGEFVYECKTCNRCFPSFQALGGHRTSHKKPRLLLPPAPPSSDDNNPATLVDTAPTTAPSPPHAPSAPPQPKEETAADATVLLAAVPALAPPKQEPQPPVAVVTGSTSNSKHPRVHECSICGAEFASGQALGGHMRRHRPLVPASAAAREDTAVHAPASRVKEKSLLELDLNMPAPCDEGVVTSPRFAAFSVAAERPPPAPPLLFPAALVDCHY